MFDLIRRLVWFALAASTLSYAGLLFAGNFVSAQAARAYDPTLVRDEIELGAHHLSGMVMVPATCDELSMRIEQVDTFTYALRFSTWREPSVPCTEEETPRAFREVLFAPSAGIHIIATLDERALPIAIIPITAASSTQ